MKNLRIACPNCGAHLDVDIDSGQARCRFCNEIFSLDTRRQGPGISDAEQMGYDFERGRQRASVEFAQGYADRMAEEHAYGEQWGFDARNTVSAKSKMVTLLLSLFLGPIGAHCFYAGRMGRGVLFFFTVGLFGFGWIYDTVQIALGKFTDGYGLPIVY